MTVTSGAVVSFLAAALLAGCEAIVVGQETRVVGQDAAIVLSWSREGGFAGFCDTMNVTASGDVTASSCRASDVKSGKLSRDDLSRLKDWLAMFGGVSITSADPATADGMTLKLTLAGKGRSQPSAEQRQEMLDWAQRVFARTSG